jgi:hypothetical protein
MDMDMDMYTDMDTDMDKDLDKDLDTEMDIDMAKNMDRDMDMNTDTRHGHGHQTKDNKPLPSYINVIVKFKGKTVRSWLTWPCIDHSSS